MHFLFVIEMLAVVAFGVFVINDMIKDYRKKPSKKA